MNDPVWEFRDAVVDDAPALADIERAAGHGRWTTEAFAASLRGPGTYARVATAAGRVVAYVMMRRAAGEAEILNLGTAPSHQRRGLAKRLLLDAMARAVTEGATVFYLEVRAGNVAARSLYDSLGFSERGRRRGYYREPDEDALIMARTSDVAGAGR